MDLMLTPEQELIKSTAREVLDAQCPISHVRAMDADPVGYSPELWKQMVELGWTGLALPESLGGVGATFVDLCLVIEEMGRVQLPSPFLPTAVLCALPIAGFGTDAQKSAYLEAVAAGDKIMSYGGVGPRGGWDPVDVGVVAGADGDDHVLEGTALFVPYAHVADDLLLVARHDGAGPDELTAFVVDTSTPGIACEQLETTGVGRECRVDLDRVRVPADTVLGGVGEGLAVAADATSHGTAALCAQMVGGAQRVLDMTVTYAQQRQQFGRAVGSFQAVQHHCANMAMDVLGSRFIAYEAIWRLAEGLDASQELSMAKSWVSEAYRRVCALGHQVHGAIGFTQEYDLQYYFRHAADAELTFGDATHHHELLAHHLGV